MSRAHFPRALSIAAVAVCTAATISACQTGANAELSDTTLESTNATTTGGSSGPRPTESNETTNRSTAGDDDLSEAYDRVLESAPADSQYALVDITSDGDPELLLKTPAEGQESLYDVSVYDTSGTEVPVDGVTTGKFADGLPGAGGRRYELAASKDDDGILFSLRQSMDTEMTMDLWTIDNGAVRKTGQSWTYPVAAPPAPADANAPADLVAKSVDIDWKPLPGATGAATGDTSGGTGPATSGRSKADYPNFGAGTTNSGQTQTTSDQFARAVYNAWIDQYIATGNLDAVVTATSEATGETYDMTCSAMGPNVICTGGNNASVQIYPPASDPSTLPGGVQWG
ncbi:Putative secreted protein [Corynebacterium glyciniphilum AJ 3170]|uniref:Putative secreted protein n=1 Tax=Corynebacterium glyciniphilum AJ 3170 TaxID=1404245 RepID=X5EBT2_9CORY|nr:Putative secreted protein [Corynebacterium glyciniphilum AJ 3170]